MSVALMPVVGIGTIVIGPNNFRTFDMLKIFDQVQEAVAAIRKRWSGTPHAGIILGTGLGALAREIRGGGDD